MATAPNYRVITEHITLGTCTGHLVTADTAAAAEQTVTKTLPDGQRVVKVETFFPEPAYVGAVVRDRDGFLWRRAQRLWHSHVYDDPGYPPARLPWSALQLDYGPLAVDNGTDSAEREFRAQRGWADHRAKRDRQSPG